MRRFQTHLFLAFTLITVGYFMVWLPHPAAGLSFIGLEMGEEAKFLPAVQSGEILPGRSFFYLPPVSVGLMLALLSALWPNRRWQTWAARVLAIAFSLLAFPALEVVGTTTPDEWLWRIAMIGLVAAAAGIAALFGDRLRALPTLFWLLFALIAVAGVLFPTWVYLEVRSAFSALLAQRVGIGPGVWLNLAGHLLVLRVALWELAALRRDTAANPVA